MKNILKKLIPCLLFAVFVTACTNENMALQYPEGIEGKVVIRSYNAMQDSLQINAGGKFLQINKKDAFKGKIVTDYQFVFYNNAERHINIINKATGDILQSYTFTTKKPIDTLSFYGKENIWVENVMSNPPGALSSTGQTGYRFTFPTLNRFSNSGYDGPLDAIIKKVNGQVLGIAENITKDSFSTFLEFPYGSPPILNIELVKHGTTESYVSGQKVLVQIVMQNNKSRLIVLDEKANENGIFTGVDGTLNLVDFFDF
ncbi:hypothetical protein AMR72_02365 [Flavobacterium psychrophilum]|nr:hypothetical protein AMR72_02365 [Flavobacterium psychrophilum]AOE51465.1 hypothetical protein ALW18_02365 [Flavobacterium psychrophilum]